MSHKTKESFQSAHGPYEQFYQASGEIFSPFVSLFAIYCAICVALLIVLLVDLCCYAWYRLCVAYTHNFDSIPRAQLNFENGRHFQIRRESEENGDNDEEQEEEGDYYEDQEHYAVMSKEVTSAQEITFRQQIVDICFDIQVRFLKGTLVCFGWPIALGPIISACAVVLTVYMVILMKRAIFYSLYFLFSLLRSYKRPKVPSLVEIDGEEKETQSPEEEDEEKEEEQEQEEEEEEEEIFFEYSGSAKQSSGELGGSSEEESDLDDGHGTDIAY